MFDYQQASNRNESPTVRGKQSQLHTGKQTAYLVNPNYMTDSRSLSKSPDAADQPTREPDAIDDDSRYDERLHQKRANTELVADHHDTYDGLHTLGLITHDNRKGATQNPSQLQEEHNVKSIKDHSPADARQDASALMMATHSKRTDNHMPTSF